MVLLVILFFSVLMAAYAQGQQISTFRVALYPKFVLYIGR